MGNCGIHYTWREDAELAVNKLRYLRETGLDEVGFKKVVPDDKNNWLNHSDTDFDSLLPLADRTTKLAKLNSRHQSKPVFGKY